MNYKDFLNLSFEEQQNLFKGADTDGQEDLKNKILNSYLDSIEDDEQRIKLAQFQFSVINPTLRKYKNPLSRMEAMRTLLNEGFQKFNESLEPFRTKE